MDAELQDIELVVEAKLLDTRGSVDVASSLQILSCQVKKVITAHLKLEMLDVIVNDLRADSSKLFHGVFLMLRLDGHCTVLDHEAKVVKRDTNDENWHVVSNRARFKQVNCKEERVIVL